MNHSIAQPSVPWDGFEFRAYGLDSNKFWDQPLVQKTGRGNDEVATNTTIGQALKDYGGPEYTVDVALRHLVGPSKEHVSFTSPRSFYVSLFFMLVSLRKDGYEPLQCTFYFYDKDRVSDDLHCSYAFFVAHGHKIVREEAIFNDHAGNGFDPTILTSDAERPIWRNHRYFDEAHTRLMYRKFYEETYMGRLMVARLDKPELYGGRDNPDFPQQAATRIGKQLSGIGLALWILVALIALMLYRQWH